MIKTIILDQEGTIYTNKKIEEIIHERTKNFFCEKLNINTKSYSLWYEKIKKKYPNILEAIKHYNLKVKDYHEYVFDSIDPSLYLKYDKNLRKVLHKVRVPIYIVTTSSHNFSLRVLESLGIEKLCKKTLSLSDKIIDKFSIYKKILKVEKLRPDEICIVGDNFKTDLEKATDKGFITVKIGDYNPPFEIDSIFLLKECINQIDFPRCCFFKWSEVDKMVKEISIQMKEKSYSPDVIIAVSRDGLIPARILHNYMPKTNFEILHIRRYKPGKKAISNPKIYFKPKNPIKNKKILIVDDMTDEGTTIKMIKNFIAKYDPSQIKTVVLYSKNKNKNIADFISKNNHLNKFAIFPWNKFEMMKDFVERNLKEATDKKIHTTLKKIGFRQDDIRFYLRYLKSKNL
jgi:hypoxanthine phosphoribosyltransferase/FMN phosphatase YigB (HAD superfamily)